MEHMHGKYIRAHLKGREIPSEISGILIGMENGHIYIQSHPGEDGLFVIPQENIKYYQTSSVSFEKEQESETTQQQEEEPDPLALSVYVDKELITTIPVPPTFNLNVCNDDVLKVAWGNPDVRSALAGKTQKSIEYYPGVMKINTDNIAQQPPPVLPKSDNTFSMNGGNSPVSTFLNPSDMVARLSNLKKGNNNEQQ